MAGLFNLARMTTTTTGTGSTIALTAAVSGFLTFALAGVTNGIVVSYAIRDGNNSEVGTATYSTTGPQLTGRTPVKSTNSDAAINLSGTAEIAITPLASDIIPPTRIITAGTGLTGGGDLSADRTISLTTPVTVSLGGTGATTLTGLLQGNGSGAITGITNSSTVGQVLRVTGASTYAWGALDLADTDAVTGALPGVNGGTGLNTAAVGDLIYASATTPTWSRLADVATGSVLVSGGVNTAPAWSAAITVTTSVTSAALIGSTSVLAGATSLQSFGGDVLKMQLQGNDATAGLGLAMFNATAGTAATLDFYRSKSGTVGTATVVASGDNLGEINFWGAQQTGTFATQNRGAQIRAEVDGTVTSGAGADMPGRLALFTTPDASGTPVERVRVKSDGSVIFNIAATPATSGQVSTLLASAFLTNSSSYFNMSLETYSADAAFSGLAFGKSRNATAGAHTVVQNGDQVGLIWFFGSDGTTMRRAASFEAAIDGSSISSTSMPGRLSFGTTPSGATTFTERMRISATGTVNIYGGTGSAGVPLSVADNNFSTSSAIEFQSYNSGTGGNVVMASKNYNNDTFGDLIQAHYSRGTRASPTAVQTNDSIGDIAWFANTNTSAQEKKAGSISCGVDAAVTSNVSVPGRISIATAASGSGAPTERVRIDSTGAVYFFSIGTTASAANMFVNTASSPANSILRSTSSRRYKKNIKPVSADKMKAVLALRPVEYNSLAAADDPEQTFYGLTAEDVAQIDPALVVWGFLDDDREYHKERKAMIPKQGAKMVPNFVMYDRVVLLQIAALQAEIEQLKGRIPT